MNETLASLIRRELGAAIPAEARIFAEDLARRHSGVAVLFYGSVLRTGDLDGLLDFYVLTDRATGSGVGAVASRLLWPDVSYAEIKVHGRTIRAKVAVMPMATFAQAASGRFLDTTIWTRFSQPAVLAWSADAGTHRRVVAAVSEAVTTAARFAACLGPREGAPADYWAALFRETYATEFRVEPAGREWRIMAHAPERYDRLLPVAWREAGIGFRRRGRDRLAPEPSFDLCRKTAEAWLIRRRMGKMLNVLRLMKAAFTFDGASRYALWKFERHTGIRLPLTPWRERHPILAAPGALWQIWRLSRTASA